MLEFESSLGLISTECSASRGRGMENSKYFDNLQYTTYNFDKEKNYRVELQEFATRDYSPAVGISRNEKLY